MIVTRQMTKAFACETGYDYVSERQFRARMAEITNENRQWTRKYNKLVREYEGSWKEWLDWAMYHTPLWRAYLWILGYRNM